jgi:carbonic anhydrase
MSDCGLEMSAIDRLLANNARYATGFDGANVPLPPAKRIAIVTCMDARLDVHALLGLEVGDAHVIRNAGGVVTDDAVRSLVISQRFLGTREIMLIHHTDCGMLTFTDEKLKDTIQEETGFRPPFPFLAFSDLEESVRRGVARLSASPFVPHRGSIRGFVYEVETGRLRAVAPGMQRPG